MRVTLLAAGSAAGPSCYSRLTNEWFCWQYVEDLFNALSEALTTRDLAEMNVKVDLERQKPEDVAQEFLEGKGLL